MLVLGLPCLLSACLIFLVPETKDKELPQDLKDAYNLDTDVGSTGLKNLEALKWIKTWIQQFWLF